MRHRCFAGLAALLAAVVLVWPVPARATPLDGLHYLVGSWKCTYRAGAMRLTYDATYQYDRGGRALRENASYPGGSDEEILAYDPQRKGWTAVVLDDHGSATVMRGAGSNPNRIAYVSVYPDASIAETFARTSATSYTIHATVRSGGKTIASVDTCTRVAGP